MILRLRRAHLLAMSAATLVAGAGLAAAVGARPESARPSTARAVLAALDTPPLPQGAHLLFDVARVWDEPATTARLYAVPPDGPALLELQPIAARDGAAGGALAQPDSLVYWSPAGDTLDQAFLLGTAPGHALRRYPLPDAARAGGGRLLLWSLGHHALLAAGSLPAQSAEPGAPAR